MFYLSIKANLDFCFLNLCRTLLFFNPSSPLLLIICHLPFALFCLQCLFIALSMILFPVTGNLFPVFGNWFLVPGNVCPITGIKKNTSCHKKFFLCMKENILLIEIYFLWHEINFLWQEINFLWQGKKYHKAEYVQCRVCMVNIWVVAPSAQKSGLLVLAPTPLCMQSFALVVFPWKCCLFCLCAHGQCRVYHIYHVEFYFWFGHLITFPA